MMLRATPSAVMWLHEMMERSRMAVDLATAARLSSVRRSLPVMDRVDRRDREARAARPETSGSE